MNTAILMLGSNENQEENLELAKNKIEQYYEIVSYSSIVKSKPHGKQYKNQFLNQAIKILSDEITEDVKITLKDIEMEMGRNIDSKKAGSITIDIDLIFWNEQQIHQDYDRFEFVKKCIDEIM